MQIIKLTVTAKKTTLVYKNNPADVIQHTVTYDAPLPQQQRSHIEAVGEHIIEEATSLQDAENAQGKLQFDPEQTAAPEPSDGSVVSFDTDDKDWEQERLPTLAGCSDIPDFNRMEKGHILWYIANNDKDTLIQDCKAQFEDKVSNKIDPALSIEQIRARAERVIFRNCKIK